jgi:3-hydroxyacyl-CoA dehydrogenase
MSRAAAKLVETGNIDDHLEKVAECDWIVEAVVERLDIKQALYARLEQLKRPGTAVSSNTSTIPLAELVVGRSDQFRRDFLITHFFNPPRYMRLIEIVRGPDTDASVAAGVEDFVGRMMGKHIVQAKDTPGFIANRIGNYWIPVAMNAAIDLGLTVEEADQIGGRPMGVPKTAIFGLADLVGLDIIPLVMKSLASTLPAGDAFFDALRPTPLLDRMIAEGFTGRKGKGGFYRLEKGPDGKRSKLAIDLATGEYRPERKPEPLPPEIERDLSALVSAPGKVGAYAWAMLGAVLSYAASLADVIADDIVAIDEAMKLGYNWQWAAPVSHLVRRICGREAGRGRSSAGGRQAALAAAAEERIGRALGRRRRRRGVRIHHQDEHLRSADHGAHRRSHRARAAEIQGAGHL